MGRFKMVRQRRFCAICGREFYMQDNSTYLYQFRGHQAGQPTEWFCSWTCYRKAEKARTEKARAEKARKERERKE